jgi:hypothetical protein
MRYLFFLLFTLFACNKSELSPYDKFKMECMDALKFISLMPPSTNYCKGTINNEAFYWSDATQSFKPYVSTITIVNGTSAGHVRYAFGLVDTNYFKGYPHPPDFSILLGFNLDKYVNISTAIDETIKLGRLNFSQNSNDRLGDFFVVMPVSCGRESPLGGSDTMWSSTVGSQTDSYIECTKIDKQELADSVKYNLTFKFSLNIYTDVYGEKLWNRLEDCELNIGFLVNK